MRSTPTEVVLTPPGSPSLDSSTDDAANFDEAELDGSGASYFSLEAQLRDFLAANIKSIPINGKALSIYIDQTGRDGVEYPCAVGFMDILAVDDEGAFYVFELKRGRSPDYVLGQVARYMGWLKTTIGKNAPVYGVIVSKEISSNLKFARLVAENIYLYEYEVSFSLRTAHDMTKQQDGVTVVDHPLVQHKLTLMREKDRSTKSFRQLLNEIGMLLCYEVTRDLPVEMVEIETPLQTSRQPVISGKKMVFAPILRAGVGFLDGMLELVPAARVAHIGLYRDPDTLQAVEYYFKAPSDIADRMVVVMDPMLATANSAVAAIDRLKERGARDLRFVCLLAAPEGIERLRGAHPEVRIWTAAIDEKLNDHGYIVPGLGDAGDRM